MRALNLSEERGIVGIGNDPRIYGYTQKLCNYLKDPFKPKTSASS